jgi:hypothetical protein
VKASATTELLSLVRNASTFVACPCGAGSIHLMDFVKLSVHTERWLVGNMIDKSNDPSRLPVSGTAPRFHFNMARSRPSDLSRNPAHRQIPVL